VVPVASCQRARPSFSVQRELQQCAENGGPAHGDAVLRPGDRGRDQVASSRSGCRDDNALAEVSKSKHPEKHPKLD
jgi:hypothetical protein